MFAQRMGSATFAKVIASNCYTQVMKIQNETIEEIDEALAHLSDGIRHAENFRKQHLLDLADQMLDAKLGMQQ